MNDGTFLIGEEVRDALAVGEPVVGLETSVIGQGLPSPDNLECIGRMSRAIRGARAMPAWIGVVDGRIVVGLSDPELERFTEAGAAEKVARRDIPMALAGGRLGATTVSATVWAASKAGIVVCATGGTGGVHPGPRADVSADLFELARTPPGLLVCSGPKSIVDPVATAERLEELGVALVGYRVGRLAFFLAREAPVELDHSVDGPQEAASMLHAALKASVGSTILLCNPVPQEAAMDRDEVEVATREAEERAMKSGVHGKALTPFLLAAIAEITGGRSLRANLALLEDNARVAGEVASALSVLRRADVT